VKTWRVGEKAADTRHRLQIIALLLESIDTFMKSHFSQAQLTTRTKSAVPDWPPQSIAFGLLQRSCSLQPELFDAGKDTQEPLIQSNPAVWRVNHATEKSATELQVS
jgi:hypothetical protein